MNRIWEPAALTRAAPAERAAIITVLDNVARSAIEWDRRIWGPREDPADLTEAPCYVLFGTEPATLAAALAAASELAGRWSTRSPRLAAAWILTANEIEDDLLARLSTPTEPF